MPDEPAETSDKPKMIGVMGGSFNPIHLGHALLAITVRETKPVDEVILVPVFKHPVKKDLLPFEDRVAMCELALQSSNIKVSKVEKETQESNAVMLRALRAKYPKGSQLLWVCGDDVFEWIHNEKGREMLCELDGLIVQRRLHRASDEQTDRFYKAPLDSDKVQSLWALHGVQVDFIYGELPHYSSTLVRNSPASWRAFLPQKVAAYLDERPALLAELVRTGDAPAAQEPTTPCSPEGAASLSPVSEHGLIDLTLSSAELQRKKPDELPRLLGSTKTNYLLSHRISAKSGASKSSQERKRREAATSCVMRCLEVIHALQKERGQTAISMGLIGQDNGEEAVGNLREARSMTDSLLSGDHQIEECVKKDGPSAGAVGAVVQELGRTASWLNYDRAMLDCHLGKSFEVSEPSSEAIHWMQRASLLDIFDVRVDVLIDACARALGQFVDYKAGREDQAHDNPQNLGLARDGETEAEWLLLLFQQYAHSKEALGRLRTFICAAGKHAPAMVRSSFRARRRLNEIIEHKDRMLQRVLSTERTGPTTAENPGAYTAAAVHKMLASVCSLEWELMGCFAPTTPLELMHEALSSKHVLSPGQDFDLNKWWGTLSSAIDLMVKLDQALAAFICTY